MVTRKSYMFKERSTTSIWISIFLNDHFIVSIKTLIKKLKWQFWIYRFIKKYKFLTKLSMLCKERNIFLKKKVLEHPSHIISHIYIRLKVIIHHRNLQLNWKCMVTMKSYMVMHLFVHSSCFHFDNFHSFVKWFPIKHLKLLAISKNLANNKF